MFDSDDVKTLFSICSHVVPYSSLFRTKNLANKRLLTFGSELCSQVLRKYSSYLSYLTSPTRLT
ncbi:hypothetical protein PAGA_a2298 [Pseudoalteromonas agarivorans DSM 14585]|uniref:Uncharacterized protein n=1 Tax=Pseudoalteromonas agarivorans DSM 14585 TaxID=1312369 RepID=A0ACA8DXV3_9GAMM|nr:hypothetical protein PAGA_a2298 [Pseudoalteromonas agarivorans DSM 14585]